MLTKHFKFIFLLKIFFLLFAIITLGILHINNSTENKRTDNELFSNNIFFILDISHSMNAKDVEGTYEGLKLSRLEISKDFITGKLEEFDQKEKNLKVGLILFSNNSNLFIPPTYDTKTFKTHLSQINTNYLPGGGSNISKAIKKFTSTAGKGSKGVLLSDFGNSEDFQQQKEGIKEIKEKIEDKNLSLISVGIGTEQGEKVKYPSGKEITKKGKTAKDSLNKNYAEFISKNFGSANYTVNKLSDLSGINLLKNRSVTFIKNNEDKVILEFLAGLFAILGL